jgi:hypothetical protein
MFRIQLQSLFEDAQLPLDYCYGISAVGRQIGERRLKAYKLEPKRYIFGILVQSTIVILCHSYPLLLS